MPTSKQAQTILKPLILVFQFMTTALSAATISVLGGGGDSNTTTNSTINHDNSTSLSESIREVLSDAKNSDTTLIALSVSAIVALICTIIMTHVNDYLKNKDLQEKDITIVELNTAVETLSMPPQTSRSVQMEPVEIAMPTYHARVQSHIQDSITTADIEAGLNDNYVYQNPSTKSSEASTALPSPFDMQHPKSNRPY